jgi:two-component system cell cycle sensor histidine kinase/response regulator CckA
VPLSLSSHAGPNPWSAALAAASLATATAGLWLVAAPRVGGGSPFVLLLGPAAFAADRWRWGPGAVALVLGLLLGYALPGGTAADAGAYLGVGGAVVSLASARRAGDRERAAEVAVRDALERYRGVVEQAVDGIITIDERGTVETVNPAVARAFGYAPDEVVGRNVSVLMPSPYREEHDGYLARYAATGEAKVIGIGREVRGRRKDGTEFPLELSVSEVRVASGRRFTGIVRDVSDRKRAEEARARLAAIVESSDDAIVSMTLAGVIQTWNAGAERLFGYAAPEAVGRHISLVIPPERRDEEEVILGRVRRGEPVRHFETVRLARDGRRVDVSLTVSPVRDAAGAVVGASKVARDVTDRKRAEEAVRAATGRAEEALARMRAVFSASAGGLILADGAGHILEWNPVAVRLHGYESESDLLRPVTEFAGAFTLSEPGGPPLPFDQWPLPRALRGEEVTDHELCVRRSDTGAERFISYSGTQVRGPDGGIAFAVLTLYDVTARRRAETEVRESEERLRMALRGAGGGAWDWDLGTGAAWWSDEMYDLWGVPPGTRMELDNSLAPVHDADRAAVRRTAEESIARGTPYHHEFRVVHPARGERWVASHGQVVRGGAGRPDRLIGITLDVTERHAAGEAVRLRDRAIRAVTQGILITDPARPDNPITFASAGFERMTGYAAAEVTGKNCRFLQGKDTDPDAVSAVRAAVAAGEPCTVELLNYKKDGTPFWNELSVSPVRGDDGAVTHFVGVQTDVTERRNLEARYRQAQKMEAVGQLAGGVAHDFNNLLTVINGYSEMVQGMLGEGDPIREMVAEVRHAGERATGLTGQLLAFSRQSVLEPRVVELNDLVADTSKMLKRLIGEDIGLATALAPGAGRVRVDPGQFGQVLMNLAVNARDAMPAGGKLTIETRGVALDAAYAESHPDARPGRYVLTAVSDTGTGMPEEVRARVFEPFFTTKGVGRGTGLGLSTVYGIVKQSGGFVEVYSEVGVGTTFKVYLPAAGPGADGAAAPGFAPTRGGAEVVLLVEDQSDVRRFTRVALESYGYAVVEAADGPAALAAAARPEPRIDLLLTDVVMPGMSGRQVAEALRARRPDLRVLYVSGYTDDAVVRHGILQADVAFLRKPFTPMALAQKVREVLDRP